MVGIKKIREGLQTICDTSAKSFAWNRGDKPNGKCIGIQSQYFHIIWWAHVMQINASIPSSLSKGAGVLSHYA